MKDLATAQNDYLHVSHALLYMYIAKQFVEDYGIEGEAAIRKGVELCGERRGKYLRKRHMDLGMKTNLKNHLEYNLNVMKGISFKEKFDHVTEEEDVRVTLYCPTAEAMINRGQRHLAVTYCEEIHPAMWQNYAPGTIVNLGKTCAQEGSDRCMFDIFLRPGRLTQEQRKECFEEYDPDFKGDRRDEFVFLSRKETSTLKSTIMFCSLYQKCIERFGEDGKKSFGKALENLFEDLVQGIQKMAKDYGIECDSKFLDDSLFFSANYADDQYWDMFATDEAKDFAKEHLYTARAKAVSMQ